MLHKKEGMTVHIKKNKIIKKEQLLTCIVVHRGRKSLLLLQGRHSLVLVTVKLVPAAITTFQDNQSFVAFTQYSSFPAYKLTIGPSFGEDRGHIEDSICVPIYKASDRQRLKKKNLVTLGRQGFVISCAERICSLSWPGLTPTRRTPLCVLLHGNNLDVTLTHDR